MALVTEVRNIFNVLVNPTGVITYRVFPRTSNAAMLAGVAVVSGKSLAMGAYTEVIAANGITEEYWVADGVPDTQDAADILWFQLATGAGGVEVFLDDLGKVDAIAIAAGAVPFKLTLPVPGRVPANIRLAARSAALSANARTWNLSVGVLTGLRLG